LVSRNSLPFAQEISFFSPRKMNAVIPSWRLASQGEMPACTVPQAQVKTHRLPPFGCALCWAVFIID
jgi:uncharacterized protein (DUF1499 family)